MRLNFKSIVMTVVVLAPIGWLVYLFFTYYERYEYTTDDGWSAEAAGNPYFAAQQLLQATKNDVRVANELGILDGLQADGVLVIDDANLVLTIDHANRVVDWMREGGQVIVAAQYRGEDEQDVLLSRFDVSKRGTDDGYFEQLGKMQSSGEFDQDSEQQASETENEAIRRREGWSLPSNLLRLHFRDHEYAPRVDFSGSGSLEHPDLSDYVDVGYQGPPVKYWAGNDVAVGLLQIEVGRGLLTVMADVNIFNSSQIGMFDHALLLQILTEYADQVVFLVGVNAPSLLQLLWRDFFELCIAGLVLLLVWIIYRARRFGPVLTQMDLGRRSFAEHIFAVGDFLWRNKNTDHLLDAARQDIWSAMQQRYPGFSRLSQQEKIRKLAEAATKTESEITQLMESRVPADEIYFFHLVKSLQQLRKKL